MQVCKPKPAQVDPCQKDQTKHQKITPNNNEKKHHFLFWQKHGNEPKNEQAIANKPQRKMVLGFPMKEHKNGQVDDKKHNEVSVSQPRGQHKLRQCFGHGASLAAGSDAEDTETVVIERRIKERVVITNTKKCHHDHKEGDTNKHL